MLKHMSFVGLMSMHAVIIRLMPLFAYFVRFIMLVVLYNDIQSVSSE